MDYDERAPGSGEGGDETIEIPVNDAATLAHQKRLQERRENYKRDQEMPEWDPSSGTETHPLFWFVWEDVPGKDDSLFLKRLSKLLDQHWILDVSAKIEKASAETSMIVTRGDKLVYLEILPDLNGLVISDKDGDPLLELTARESGGKTCCFSALLCNRKREGEDTCFNEAVSGNTKCVRHSNPRIGQQPGFKPDKRLGKLDITYMTSGRSCLPADAYYYWRTKEPDTAHFIDDTVERFRRRLNWDVSNPLMNELRYVVVQMVTRDKMHNKAIEADFKSAVHDPETGQIVAFKAHYLLNNITTFDARISQKLKDFGLLVPPSRTEDPHKIPVELELLWTPLKKAGVIDVPVRATESDRSQEHESKEVENGTTK